MFCPLPWLHSAIRNNGDYRVCCQANVSHGRGLLTDESSVLNARETPLSQTRNSETLKEIRRTMLEGNWPASCERCRNEEASGLRSRRIYENESWKDHFSASHAQAVTRPDGEIDEAVTPLRFLDVRFGNKCNLKCRMCGPTDSDSWYQDQGEIWGDTFKDTHGTVQLVKNAAGQWKDPLKTYEWYTENEAFWADLEVHAATLQKINIVGGEPLLIDPHYRFLEKLVATGWARKITLEYNTNLTVLPEKALELWRSFAKVRIGVSLDGFGANNSYIRFPSQWPVVVRNLQRLNSAEGPFELWLSATVQALNAFEITDLLKWKLDESGLNRFNSGQKLPVITSHALHKPEFLSLKSLPPAVKADVKNHYSDFLRSARASARWPEALILHLEKLLLGYVRFMESEDFSSQFPYFLEYTRSLDAFRGDQLKTGAPRLYDSLVRHTLIPVQAGSDARPV